MSLVKLYSADDKIIEVSKDVAKMSGLIDGMMEDIGGLATPISIPNVSGQILDKIIQFCQYHTDHPEIDINSYLKTTTLDKWNSYDSDFCTKVDMTTLFEIINGANYLDIKLLMTLLVKYNANLILGKTKEEITQIYRKPKK
jgi:S-phase kinase-associated protein 1